MDFDVLILGTIAVLGLLWVGWHARGRKHRPSRPLVWHCYGCGATEPEPCTCNSLHGRMIRIPQPIEPDRPWARGGPRCGFPTSRGPCGLGAGHAGACV